MSKKRRRKKRNKLLNNLIIILILIIIIMVGFVFLYNKYLDNKGLNKYLKIKLNGDKEIAISYADDYKELGAKATYKDKDISNKIIVNSKIDMSKLSEYKVTYTIKYKKLTKTIYRIVKVTDTITPELYLNGDKELTIYKDSKYEELGAKANDDYDGDLTDKINITGSVDTSKIGEYTLTYTVKDSSNNETKVDRIIKVIEKKVEPKPANNNSNTPDGVIGKTSKGYTIEKKNGIYYIGGVLIANKSYALPSSYNPGGLLQVFNDNFNAMKNDASNEGINLFIKSGYRSYTNQQGTYNHWVSVYGTNQADKVSARAGHSEHQTGLAADINSLDQSWANTPEGKWLNDNCYKYGFIIRYVRGKENITGYIFEPWHIRYVGKELAEKLYNNGNWITLEEYLGIDSKY